MYLIHVPSGFLKCSKFKFWTFQPTQIGANKTHDVYYSREFNECNMKYYVTENTYTTYYNT